MKKILLMLLALVLAISAGLVGCVPAEPAVQEEEARIPPAQTTSPMPPVIVVSGSDYEMGYQYGEQAAPLIYHNLVMMKSKVIAKYGKETTAKDMAVWAYYLEKYNPGLRDWLEGISRGCKKQGYDISYQDLVLITVYPAQMWARPDLPYPEETGVLAIVQASANPADDEGYHSCTVFAATGNATRDRKPVVAITKMVPIEVMHSLILIAFPDEGPSFIANPYAGAVVQNSGMNSARFAWVLTAIFGPPAWGVVTEVYFHYLTQYCESPAEAYEYIERTPRAGVTGTFTTSDATGNISVWEGDCEVFAIRKPGDAGETAPFLVQTNHFIHPDLEYRNPPWGPWNLPSKYRYATAWEYVKAAAEAGKIDFGFAKKMFASDDWYDPDTGTWHYNKPGSPNVLNSWPSSVSQSIFFPADLIAYFQVGTPSGIGLPGGATGEYVTLQLADAPATVAANASSAAFRFISEARNLLAKELNSKAPYLTDLVEQSLREMLGEAISEYERGMDRAGVAYLAGVDGAKINEQVVLWSEALTHYAKAQLYAQMVTTRLKKMAEAP